MPNIYGIASSCTHDDAIHRMPVHQVAGSSLYHCHTAILHAYSSSLPPPFLHTPFPRTDSGMLKGSKDTVEPEEVNTAELLIAHTPDYLNSLKVRERSYVNLTSGIFLSDRHRQFLYNTNRLESWGGGEDIRRVS